jgi:hypothetical protein
MQSTLSITFKQPHTHTHTHVHRLEKELTTGRNAAYTGRKALELYWNEQVKMRKELPGLEV